VEQVRRGNEAAFEVMFERFGPGILGFCRHMLRSPEEAEDAVQQTFASAYRDLLRDEREISLKPWLYAIARNRCLSMLRSRREEPAEQQDLPTAGLSEEVERRAELRELLDDLRELPEEQRAALLLSEVGDLSHADVAGVLGCEVPRVKALVFRARSGLIERRDARETPCEEIREQLANLKGGALRRSELRHHLRQCPGCRAYREKVKEQRQLMALALPVVPSLGLKSSVLSAMGFGGGSGGGGAAVGGGLGASLAGAGGSFGGATIAKVAIVGAIATGGAAAGGAAVIDHNRDAGRGSASVEERQATQGPSGGNGPLAGTPVEERSRSLRGKLRGRDLAETLKGGAGARGLGANGGRGKGAEHVMGRGGSAHTKAVGKLNAKGRGRTHAVAAPVKPVKERPVKPNRGSAEPKLRSEPKPVTTRPEPAKPAEPPATPPVAPQAKAAPPEPTTTTTTELEPAE
jgi:RNA polymerase sigma factor (sigma-70 family)